MRSIITILVAILVASCANQSIPLHEINRQSMGCSALKEFRDAGPEYFSKWTDGDFKSAASLARMCRTVFNDNQTELLIEKLNFRKLEKQEAEAAERIAREERRARWLQCTEGKDYQFYLSEQSVIKAREWVGELTKKKNAEIEYANESGVRDLTNERAIGVMLVDARKRLSESYADYRRRGGRKALGEVSVTTSDPCR